MLSDSVQKLGKLRNRNTLTLRPSRLQVFWRGCSRSWSDPRGGRCLLLYVSLTGEAEGRAYRQTCSIPSSGVDASIATLESHTSTVGAASQGCFHKQIADVGGFSGNLRARRSQSGIARRPSDAAQ
ncbi:hypothetical protein B0H19DRAFT_1101189 [Mycena capillaripes]|nr:hypothetical protein B0H19DRAFT_1101189 [Mycena capillaripes]